MLSPVTLSLTDVLLQLGQISLVSVGHNDARPGPALLEQGVNSVYRSGRSITDLLNLYTSDGMQYITRSRNLKN